MTKRLLAALACLCVALAMLPVTALAADKDFFTEQIPTGSLMANLKSYYASSFRYCTYLYDTYVIANGVVYTGEGATDKFRGGGGVIQTDTNPVFSQINGVMTLQAVPQIGYEFVGWKTRLYKFMLSPQGGGDTLDVQNESAMRQQQLRWAFSEVGNPAKNIHSAGAYPDQIQLNRWFSHLETQNFPLYYVLEAVFKRKTLSVTVSGNGKDMYQGESTGTYGNDFTFKVMNPDRHTVTVSYTTGEPLAPGALPPSYTSTDTEQTFTVRDLRQDLYITITDSTPPPPPTDYYVLEYTDGKTASVTTIDRLTRNEAVMLSADPGNDYRRFTRWHFATRNVNAVTEALTETNAAGRLPFSSSQYYTYDYCKFTFLQDLSMPTLFCSPQSWLLYFRVGDVAALNAHQNGTYVLKADARYNYVATVVNGTFTTDATYTVSAGTTKEYDVFQPNGLMGNETSFYLKADPPPAGMHFKQWDWYGSPGNMNWASGGQYTTPTWFTAAPTKLPTEKLVFTAVYEYDEGALKNIVVNNGYSSASGDPTVQAKSPAGVQIALFADEPAPGKLFDKWVVNKGAVVLASETDLNTTFDMPNEDVEVTATYKDPPATVTAVTVSPATASVAKGARRTFTATVTGTNNPEKTVAWTVEGATSASTQIDANGALTVGGDEKARTLTVRATSTADPTKSGTALVRVTSPAVPKTGDSAAPGLWLGLMLAAAMGLTACLARRRAKRGTE